MLEKQIPSPYVGLNLRECFLTDFKVPEKGVFVIKNVIFDREYMLQVATWAQTYMFVPEIASLQTKQRQWLYARFNVETQKFVDAAPGIIREPSSQTLAAVFALVKDDSNSATYDKLWSAKVAKEDSPYSFWDYQYERLYGPAILEPQISQHD